MCLSVVHVLLVLCLFPYSRVCATGCSRKKTLPLYTYICLPLVGSKKMKTLIRSIRKCVLALTGTPSPTYIYIQIEKSRSTIGIPKTIKKSGKVLSPGDGITESDLKKLKRELVCFCRRYFAAFCFLLFSLVLFISTFFVFFRDLLKS